MSHMKKIYLLIALTVCQIAHTDTIHQNNVYFKDSNNDPLPIQFQISGYAVTDGQPYNGISVSNGQITVNAGRPIFTDFVINLAKNDDFESCLAA